MRTYRCAGCGHPLAGFVGRLPAGLPFAEEVAVAQAEAALLRHLCVCPMGGHVGLEVHDVAS